MLGLNLPLPSSGKFKYPKHRILYRYLDSRARQMSRFGGDGVYNFQGYTAAGIFSNNLRGYNPILASTGEIALVAKDFPSSVFLASCVLCGKIIMERSDATFEHTVPAWLHRITKTEKADALPFFRYQKTPMSWSDLKLLAHSECNKQFGEKIEEKARPAFLAMLNGESLQANQIEFIFDLLDKIRSTAAHTATAFDGHNITPETKSHSFPNIRVGLNDRIFFAFRVRNAPTRLSIIDPLSYSFITTPSALIFQINDLVLLSVSSFCIMSKALGLNSYHFNNGEIIPSEGQGRASSGFVVRETALNDAEILAQPMRRQLFNLGHRDKSPFLDKRGDGKICQKTETGWRRLRNICFSNLPVYDYDYAMHLIKLEMYEWLRYIKLNDYANKTVSYGMIKKTRKELFDNIKFHKNQIKIISKNK